MRPRHRKPLWAKRFLTLCTLETEEAEEIHHCSLARVGHLLHPTNNRAVLTDITVFLRYDMPYEPYFLQNQLFFPKKRQFSGQFKKND